MRKEFLIVKTRYKAKKQCAFEPDVIAKVCGGYMCFESRNDYLIWKNQK